MARYETNIVSYRCDGPGCGETYSGEYDPPDWVAVGEIGVVDGTHITRAVFHSVPCLHLFIDAHWQEVVVPEPEPINASTEMPNVVMQRVVQDEPMEPGNVGIEIKVIPADTSAIPVQDV